MNLSKKEYSPLRIKAMETVERKCLDFLARGGAFAALDIQKGLGNGLSRGGTPYIWESIINMERSWLVCRARDYEHPETDYQWKITGCGLLSRAAPAD